MDFLRIVARDLFGAEIVERVAEILALAQDRDPRQPGLEPVEDEFLIERAIVIFRHTPFGVVIGDIERVVAGPRAPHLAVGMQTRRAAHATVCFAVDRRDSGSARRSPRPPAVSASPALSASVTRSVRISARPYWPEVEPMVPTGLSPARMAVPGSGANPSRMTFAVRVRAMP